MDSNLLHEGSTKLCSICAKIDIKRFLEPTALKFPEDENGIQVATWSLVAQDIEKRDCTLCKLFASICSDDVKLNQQLRAFTKLPPGDGTYSKSEPVNSFGDDIIPNVFLAMLRDNIKSNYSRVKHEIVHGGLIVPQWTDQKIVNHIVSESADFNLLCSWLSSCQLEHRDCQASADLKPDMKYLNLIDCIDSIERRIIIVRSCLEPYIALSYVWGGLKEHRFQLKSNAEQNATWRTHALESAPQTITDAMIAVKALGCRYLWVDQYCIDQDSDSMRFILENMHQIYGNAEATIVALHGSNCYDGLPGVTDVFRSQQMRALYGNIELCATLPSVGEAIHESKWNTRAWTYQEARLSKRILFFSKHQVYFVCRSDCRSETINTTSSSVFGALNGFRINPSLFLNKKISNHETHLLDRYVYSHKELTEQKDVLDAFRGILSRYNWISFYGVYIIVRNSNSDCYDGFAMGLTWMRDAAWAATQQRQYVRLTRKDGHRQGFPSWSWASIIGPTPFDMYKPESILGLYLHGMDYPATNNPSKFRVWIANEADEWELLSTAIKKQTSSIMKEKSPLLRIEGDVVKVWREGPVTSKERKSDRPIDEQVWSFEGSPENVSKATPWSPDHFIEHDWTLVPRNALVLINWHDHNESTSKRRFVLMVLDEVDNNTFRRVGILSAYRKEWEEADISKIMNSKRRMKFDLT